MRYLAAFALALWCAMAFSTVSADEADELNRAERVGYCLQSSTDQRDTTCRSPAAVKGGALEGMCADLSRKARRMFTFVNGAMISHPASDWSAQVGAAMLSGRADQKACTDELHQYDSPALTLCMDKDVNSGAFTECLDKAGFAPECRRLRVRCDKIDDALPY